MMADEAELKERPSLDFQKSRVGRGLVNIPFMEEKTRVLSRMGGVPC
jgi:hypothetical protein